MKTLVSLNLYSLTKFLNKVNLYYFKFKYYLIALVYLSSKLISGGVISEKTIHSHSFWNSEYNNYRHNRLFKILKYAVL